MVMFHSSALVLLENLQIIAVTAVQLLAQPAAQVLLAAAPAQIAVTKHVTMSVALAANAVHYHNGAYGLKVVSPLTNSYCI